jgi:hypothetical protein
MHGGDSAQFIEIAGGDALAPAFAAAVLSASGDWILPKRDVEGWLRAARPGERLLYAQGLQLVRGDTSEMLRNAQAAGDVLLFQPRSSDRIRFDYIAIKRLTERSKQMAGRTADPAMRLIFRRLQRAASTGERCPSDRMLAALTGLRVPQVQWRLQKLINEARIRTRVEWIPSEPRFRIVSILDKDGNVVAETASPEALQ